MGLAARFALVVFSAAAYLALRRFRLGRRALLPANSARIALAIATLAMAVVAMFSGGNVNPGVREDRSNRWVIAAFAVLGLVACFPPAYTDRIGLWTIDGNAIRWWGVAIFCTGGTLASGRCLSSSCHSAVSWRSNPATRW